MAGGRRAGDLLLDAIAAVNAAADGADDSEVTPSQIAELIRRAAASPDLAQDPARARVHRFLLEALDAVADGLPADGVATYLYAALGAINELAEGRRPEP